MIMPKVKGTSERGDGLSPADTIDLHAPRVRPPTVRSASSSVSGNTYRRVHSRSRKTALSRANTSAYADRLGMRSHPDSPTSSSRTSSKAKSRHQRDRSERSRPNTVRRDSDESGGHGVPPKAQNTMPIPSEQPYQEHYTQGDNDDSEMSAVDMSVSSTGVRSDNGPEACPRQRRQRSTESDRRRRRGNKIASRRKRGRSPRTPPSAGIAVGDSGSRSHSRSGDNESQSSDIRHHRSSDEKQAKIGGNGSQSRSRLFDSSKSSSESGHEQTVCVT